MNERDNQQEIMCYGYTAWVVGLIIVAIIIGLMFGFAHPIS